MKILKKGGLTGYLEELHTEQVATQKNSHYMSFFGKGQWNTTARMSLIKREWASSLSLGLMTESWQPYARNLAVIRLWHIESNAFDKSVAITTTSFFKSRAWRQSSVSLNKAVQHEWPRRKPDIFFENRGEKCMPIQMANFQLFEDLREWLKGRCWGNNLTWVFHPLSCRQLSH